MDSLPHRGRGSAFSCLVTELVRPHLPDLQVPFLSVGGDIGVRTVQHQDCSPLSGDYVIEDVQGDDRRYFRRLIFLSSRNVVQSEARLLKDVSHRGEASGAGHRVGTAGTPNLGRSEGPGGVAELQDRPGSCDQRHVALWVALTLSGLLGWEGRSG